MIGIKPNSAVIYRKIPLAVDVTIGADGKKLAGTDSSPEAAGCRARLSGPRWNGVALRAGDFHPADFDRSIDTSENGAEISAAVDWGRYRLEVETADPGGPATMSTRCRLVCRSNLDGNAGRAGNRPTRNITPSAIPPS